MRQNINRTRGTIVTSMWPPRNTRFKTAKTLSTGARLLLIRAFLIRSHMLSG